MPYDFVSFKDSQENGYQRTEMSFKRQSAKAELDAQLAIEMNKQVIYTESQIRRYLISLRTGDLNDINIRR